MIKPGCNRPEQFWKRIVAKSSQKLTGGLPAKQKFFGKTVDRRTYNLNVSEKLFYITTVYLLLNNIFTLFMS